MKTKLRDLADIRSGYQFRGKVAETTDANVAVIQIKDIDEWRHVNTSGLVSVRLENPEAYLVSQGDVLFLSRGHRQYATVIAEPVRNTIVTGYFFVLRPRAELVRSTFLAWSLNQPEFQEALRPVVRGSHMPLVSKGDFQELTIRVPPLAVQDRIVEINELFDRERELTAAVMKRRGELVQAVSRKLLTGDLKAEGDVT